jgi:hypothetical protein
MNNDQNDEYEEHFNKYANFEDKYRPKKIKDIWGQSEAKSRLLP